jgi:hypothetical protein
VRPVIADITSRRRATTSRLSAASPALLRLRRQRLVGADHHPLALNHPRDSGGSRGDQYRAQNDSNCLSARRGAFARRQRSAVSIVVRFALPERGKRHSRFLSRLQKADRRETDGQREEEARCSRCTSNDESDDHDHRDRGPDPAGTPANPRSPLSNVVYMLGHRGLTSTALRECSLWLGGAWKQIARGASLRTRAHTITS